ncbi:MAG TPA: hypothetical protein PLN69_03445 [bacterium]|nr:hypothetical protein [bacterium]
MTTRVWSEFFNPADFLRKDVMGILSRYDVSPCIAFQPYCMNDEFARVFAEYEQAGIPVTVWALLPEESGYWACEQNAHEFSAFVESIFDWADEKGFGIPWLAIDMESPMQQMDLVKNIDRPGYKKKLLKTVLANRNKSRFYDSATIYSRLVESVHQRGSKTIAAVLAVVMEDIRSGRTGIQDAVETPVSTINFDVLSFMIYNTTLEDFSGGIMSIKDGNYYLYSAMKDMRGTLGNRAGVSIGVTGAGLVSRAPADKTPATLTQDMRAAKAAGVEDISIYNLEGIMSSDRPEAWFESLLNCETAVPDYSLKSNIMRKTLQAAAFIL